MQLSVEQLVVNRGDRRVIDDLSFSLKAGEAMTLLGPNGVGKTTLIRALAGFLTPLSGKINLQATDLDPDKPIPESCHYVGHANGTKASLTVGENLVFWARYLNDEKKSADARTMAANDALAHFDLLDLASIPAGYLSAGQKRRLGLARLLVAKRPLWLLDEPTVSLDTRSVELLADAVQQHVKTGGLVIAATHIPLGLDNARELHLTRAPVSRQVHA